MAAKSITPTGTKVKGRRDAGWPTLVTVASGIPRSVIMTLQVSCVRFHKVSLTVLILEMVFMNGSNRRCCESTQWITLMRMGGWRIILLIILDNSSPPKEAMWE